MSPMNALLRTWLRSDFLQKSLVVFRVAGRLLWAEHTNIEKCSFAALFAQEQGAQWTERLTLVSDLIY